MSDKLPPSLSETIGILQTILAEKTQLLSHPPVNGSVLAEKLALDRALAVLIQAETLRLRGKERVTLVPATRVRSPSASYRVMEDNESDNRGLWSECSIHIEEGDIILKRD